ncbi:MAG: SAM-dependent methyltransferase [Puniceicoccaceae bacterium]
MSSIPPDPAVLDALKERMPPDQSAMPLDAYIDCVLYHPQAGYYMRDKERVGYRPETDFYTASSMGPLFTRLIISAVEELLGENLSEYTFVEFGPESPQGILGSLEKKPPFRKHQLYRPGSDIRIPDKAIVFSNELFDAQPFKRFIQTNEGWKETGVAIVGESISYCILEPSRVPTALPASAPEGYTVDWPLHAHALLEQICSQSWDGLFLAFDYGLDRSIILSQRPEGTGRTYYQHQLGSDLLSNPGFTDITCHLIWEEMEERLRAHGFGQMELMRQEAFFMKHAQRQIQLVMESTPAGFSKEKQTLMELLHPGNMGHKFQVLYAMRGES